MLVVTRLRTPDPAVEEEVRVGLLRALAILADIPALARILKHAVHRGAYEVQLNVLSHEQLKDAKAHPEKYPNLIIRVWGFSAYFCDLPASYQDEFIRRTAPSCSPSPSL